jgi:D-alanyl-D-alanine dipeptidase
MDVVPGRWNIKFDIRYATRNNVFGEQLYQRARPMLISPALIALDSAAAMLHKKGFGLIVYDAYRPWSVTEKMWQLTDSHKRAFVSNPSKGSRHNRGCAVDVGLYHLASGLTAEMPSDYDDFSEKASAS